MTELYLESPEEKTLLTHINDGFDFLGLYPESQTGRTLVVHLRPAREEQGTCQEETQRPDFSGDEPLFFTKGGFLHKSGNGLAEPRGTFFALILIQNEPCGI